MEEVSLLYRTGIEPDEDVMSGIPIGWNRRVWAALLSRMSGDRDEEQRQANEEGIVI